MLINSVVQYLFTSCLLPSQNPCLAWDSNPTQPDYLQGLDVLVLVIYLKPEAAENTTSLTIKTT